MNEKEKIRNEIQRRLDEYVKKHGDLEFIHDELYGNNHYEDDGYDVGRLWVDENTINIYQSLLKFIDKL